MNEFEAATLTRNKYHFIFRITAVHLSKTFSGDTQKLFNAREKMDLIVLLDEDTSETPTSDTSKSIWVLREIFMNV